VSLCLTLVNYKKQKKVLVLIPEIINTRGMRYEIQKRLFKAGTHKAQELWFITSSHKSSTLIEQGPYGSLEEALEDTKQPHYDTSKGGAQVQFCLDLVAHKLMEISTTNED
jgi:hypothetical protein